MKPRPNPLLRLTAALAIACAAVHADTVVYFDDFNDQQNVNTGGPYTQTLATTTTTTGGGTWLAGVETGGWGQRDYGDSNVATPTSSNFLAFTPDSGLTYTVQMTVDTTPLGGAGAGSWGESWMTPGFTSYQHNWNGADGGTIDTANLVRFKSNTVATITYTRTGSDLVNAGINYVGWITDWAGLVNLNASQQVKIDNFSLTHNFVNSDVLFTASAAKTVTLTGTNNTFTTGGKIQVDSTVGANLSTVTGGTINAPTGEALVIQQDNTSGGLNIASILNGSNGLTKTGGGTATLTGANTYTLGTTISGGTLALSGSGTLGATTGALTINDATLDLGSTTQTVASVASGSTSSNNSGAIIGTGTLSVSGNFVYQGYSLNGGVYGGNPTFTVASNVAVTGDTLIGRANFTITGGNFTTNRFTANPSSADWANLTISGGNVTATNGIDGTYGTDGSNGTTATFQLNLNGGTLYTPSLKVADREVGPGNDAWLTFNGTTVKATADTPNFITTYGGGTNAYISNGGANIDTNGKNIGIGVNLRDSSGHNGTLAKQGDGTLTLSATNTYTGATTVSAGTLKVTGSIATSDVTVSGGILASGSTGTVGNNVTVNTGATFAAGDVATVGAASVASNLNFSSGSIFDWDLTTSSNTYDTVSVAGTLTIDSGAKFNVVSSTAFTDTFWDATHTWSDIFGGKAIDNFLVTNFLYSGSATAPATEGFFTVSGSSLTWTAVPEPTSALAGLLLTAGLLRRRRNG